MLLSLLVWSFRRDMRVLHDRGRLAVPSHRLETEVTLFLVWLAWFASAMWRARGHAFTLSDANS